MFVCTPHIAGVLGGQKRASDPLNLELRMVELLCWCWELNTSHLEEQQMFLTIEPSL